MNPRDRLHFIKINAFSAVVFVDEIRVRRVWLAANLIRLFLPAPSFSMHGFIAVHHEPRSGYLTIFGFALWRRARGGNVAPGSGGTQKCDATPCTQGTFFRGT